MQARFGMVRVPAPAVVVVNDPSGVGSVAAVAASPVTAATRTCSPWRLSRPSGSEPSELVSPWYPVHDDARTQPGATIENDRVCWLKSGGR